MKKKKVDKYLYSDPVYEQAEVSANRFNLIFAGALLILDLTVLVLSILGVFAIDLRLMTVVCVVSFFLFLSPIVVWLFHDIILN